MGNKASELHVYFKEIIKNYTNPNPIVSLTYSADGEYLVVSDSAGYINFFNYTSGLMLISYKISGGPLTKLVSMIDG